MTATLSAAAAYPVRPSTLQQPALRRPTLRLVGSVETSCRESPVWRPEPRPFAAPRTAPLAPAIDEEDAERWDGLA